MSNDGFFMGQDADNGYFPSIDAIGGGHMYRQ